MELFPASRLKQPAVEPARLGRWTVPEITGRLVEVSGSGESASLTLAFGLVLEAQQRGELVGWSTANGSSFYPPDAAERGVDVGSLVVVRVPDLYAVPRAGEKLLRSGAFGLVVLDIGAVKVPMPLQSRLAGLANRHHAALVCLTEKTSKEPSLGSLVSLRVQARREKVSEGQFACKLRVLKDKRRGPTWTQQEVCRGPAGLR